MRALSVCASAALVWPVYAATDRYDYDALGRLIRRIDDQNRATDYTYDAAGNITRVTGGVQADPLVVTTGNLGDLRQNQSRQVSIAGQGLQGASLRLSSPRITVGSVIASSNAISFRISAYGDAPLGAQTIYIENASGSAAVGFNVVPKLPFEILPEPVALSPDGIARSFIFNMGEPAAADMTFSLSTVAPSIARTTASQLVIPAGQQQTTFGLKGLSEGVSLVRIGHESFSEPVESLVYVSSGASDRQNFSVPVGIAKGLPWSVSPTTQSYSGLIGIAKGVPWSVSPSTQTLSGPIGISKGVPWSVSPTMMSNSGPVGVAKGVPWSVSANAGPVIAPLVGIVK